MRERLIALLKEAHDEQKYITSDESITAIADYLLESGVIIPPCKVGDKLYAISENYVKECTCDEISIHNEISICADFQCDYDCKGCPFNAWKQDFHTGEYSCDGEYGTHFFSIEDFGKTVFLTREEAEAKLRENNGKK